MRYDFLNTKKGRVIIYTEAINSNAYQSIHLVNNLSEDEAKRAFHREHKKEVLTLLQQNKINNHGSC